MRYMALYSNVCGLLLALVEPNKTVLGWRPGDPQELFGVIRKGLMMAMIYRGDYWQVAYLMPKGTNQIDD